MENKKIGKKDNIMISSVVSQILYEKPTFECDKNLERWKRFLYKKKDQDIYVF